jgi:hypothetical protein
MLIEGVEMLMLISATLSWFRFGYLALDLWIAVYRLVRTLGPSAHARGFPRQPDYNGTRPSAAR